MGTATLVACPHPHRGDRRRLFNPEHLLDKRGAGLATTAICWVAQPSRDARSVIGEIGITDPFRWLFQAESPTAKDVCGLPGRSIRRFADTHARPADGKASPGAAGAKWSGARNRRLHPSLRGSAPIFVVDAYTRRLLARPDILPENEP